MDLPLQDPALRAIGRAALGSEIPAGIADRMRPLVEALPVIDRLQLVAAIPMMNFGGPIVSGVASPMTALAIDAGERVMRDWLTSTIPQRRRVAAALRTLTAFAHYGHADSWEAVGYGGPWLNRLEIAVEPAPELRPRTDSGPRRATDPRPGITSLAHPPRDLRLRTQVCVIGSGAGGAAAAARLAELGREVIVLEAGPLFGAEEVTQRTLDTLPRLYRDGGLRSTADQAIGILQGRGVGGSTLHNTGLVYPPPDAVLERWAREHGFEAPEAFAGEATAVMAALRATPIPLEEINPNNETLRRGAEALGWRTRTPLHNRVACSGCGYCMLGCAYNRKWNAAFAWLPDAIGRGVRVISDAAVYHLARQRGGWSIRASGPRGRRARIHADQVVVASGALDTPALLRRSGLGPPSVGEGLRIHPSVSVSAVFDEPVRAWRGLPQSVLLEEFADFMHGDGYGGFMVIPSAANTPALAAALTPGVGREHRRRMEALRFTASASVMVHDETRGRVRAGPGGRPSARYWPEADDQAELRRGMEALGRAYFAAGARRVVLPFHAIGDIENEAELTAAVARAPIEPHRIVLNSVHPQGSCALGADKTAPVTPEGAVRGEPGLFVADTSLFPTSIGVPPQVTTMTLARRVAERAAR